MSHAASMASFQSSRNVEDVLDERDGADVDHRVMNVIVPHAKTGRFGQQVLEFLVHTDSDGVREWHHADPAWQVKLAELGYPVDAEWLDGFIEGLVRLKHAGTWF